MLLSAQYSQKDFATEGVGGTSTNIIDSPFLTRTGTQYQYNAPYFDASDPEQRNNRQLTASLTYFASDRRLRQPRAEGRLRELRRHARRRERTELDRLRLPRRLPDGGRRARASTRTAIRFRCSCRACRACSAGFRIAAPSSTRRRPRRTCRIAGSSSPKLTLNLGMRFEHAASEATDGQQVAGHRRASCRVSARLRRRTATATRCCRRRSRSIRASTTRCSSRATRTSATPIATRWSYIGPAGEGRTFAPGFDLSNYTGVVAGTFPALNVQFADDLSSPRDDRIHASARRARSARAATRRSSSCSARRRTSSKSSSCTPTAQTPIVVDGATLGQLDNIVYDNSDEMKREYQALQFMGQHRVMNALTVNGHWTLQLKNDGNFEGETPNPDRLGVRRLSGDAVARAQRAGGPARRLPAQQGSRVGRLSRRARPRTARSTSRRSIATTRRGPTASC